MNEPLKPALFFAVAIFFQFATFDRSIDAQRYYQPRHQYQKPYDQAQQPYAYPGQPINRNQQPSQLTKPGYQPRTPLPLNTDSQAIRTTYSLFPRMVAEFEPQKAIMLSVSDLQPHHSQVLVQIAKRSAGHANILILYNNNLQLKKTTEFLKNAPVNHVSFYKLTLDTVWLRDFGPRISQEENGSRSLDFYYYGVRPYDDSFPERWSLRTSAGLTKIPWTLQGGNLISNGQGLAITSRKIFEDNRVSFPSSKTSGEDFVINEVKSLCNLKDLVVLEPLKNESTKHVDMFAAFLAPGHALVAEVDPRRDPENSRILNYNAKKLRSTIVNGKPMQVSRIAIPPRDGDAWSTYTNAIFTDKLVLVPTMRSDGDRYISQAVKTYQKLLPNHHIATVDITSMKQLQGSLHCMSLNLPAFAPLPKGVISFEQAVEITKRIAVSATTANMPPAFPVDEQLRRIFKSSKSDYLVDAYAVELTGDVITLLRADDRKLIRVKTSGVCKADQYWIQRNQNKIQRNGSKVYQMVLNRPISR